MTPFLTKQRMSVEVEGDLVKLSIGNYDMHLPYEDALKLSQWLRVRGKEAKRQAGDVSRHWSAIGLIEGLK